MRSVVRAVVPLVLAAATASSAAPDPPRRVTEGEAVRLFLEQSPLARLVSIEADAARAGASLAIDPANPVAAYQIEDAAGVRDEFLTIQQELPVTGWRGLIRERASAASSAAGLRGVHDLRDATFSLRAAVHEVLYRDRVVGILEGVDRVMEEIVERIRAREAEGEASGYDVLRAEQEADEIRMEYGRARGEAAAARARFGSFFDPSLGMAAAGIDGDLSPPAAPGSLQEAVAVAMQERSDLRALREETREQEFARRAASRLRIPEPVVSGGFKRVDAPGESDTGFVAAVMVPLPFFDPGRYEAARTRAVAGRVEARREILEREIRAQVEAAFAREEAARETAVRFEERVGQRAEAARHIARLAYEEGETGILELVDAIRTSLRMEWQALTVRHEARRARIELERAIGREVIP